MSESNSPPFRIDCTECSIDYEGDDLSDTLEFAEKHRTHTGHHVEWTQADLRSEFDTDLQTAWRVTCDTCGANETFATEEEAREYSLGHSEYTTHDANVPSEETNYVLDVASVKHFVERCEGHVDTEHGVPVPALIAQAEAVGMTQQDLQDRLDDLKQTGEIYEPAPGFVRAL